MTGGRRAAQRQAGFTLLEVLIAVSIIGFLTATLVGTFRRTGKIKTRIESAQERVHVARIALMRMTREIEMAFLSENENVFITDRRTMFVATTGGDTDQLRFSWFGKQRMRAEGAEADTSLVSYYAEPDPDDRSALNLMRRETYRLEAADPATLPGEAYVLCPGIRRIKFSFYDFRKKEWREDWNTMGADGQRFLPSHVRIWLTILDERGQEVTFYSAARVQMTEQVGYRPVKQQ